MSRGHIRKRGSCWAVVVERSPDPITGKRRQKWVSGFVTRKEAERTLTKLLRELDTGTDLDPTRLTTGEYLTYWLETVARRRVRPTTFERYERAARVHIAPHIGGVPLVKLSPPHLAGLYTTLSDIGLAANTLRNAHIVLHAALKSAVLWNILPRNVADVEKPPRGERPALTVWDAATTARFLESVKGRRLEAFYQLAIATGMRRGELLGLQWQDVDLVRGSLAVRRSLVKTKQGGVAFQAPKTAKGRRQIKLSAKIVGDLQAHRKRQLEERLQLGELWQDQDLVFPGPAGGPLAGETLQGDFNRVIAHADVPRIRLHDLRHTSATLMLRQGVHPKIVSERLGHATVSITLDIYSHVLPDMQAAAADAIDAALAAAQG